jgi:uncharacterized protein (UPF0147 family)
MEKKMIEELIAKYNASQTSASELKMIEQLIESGEIELSDVTDLTHLEEHVFKMESPLPSVELDNRFYNMLTQEKKSVKHAFSWSALFSWPELLPKLALASITLLMGFLGGYVLQTPSQKTEVSELTKEVSDLKEMMMFSLLEKESATDRLKAVSLTGEMDASSKVTSALLQTLNNDNNVNVRLAALEALQPYVKDNHVREELIRSIGKQNSPLVQIALAELMAAIQEKSSVKELQKVLDDTNTPKGVRNKIKQSIDVLT